MKKGLLLAILAMFTGIALVGCGQKSEEQSTDDSSNTTVSQEQKAEENSEEQQVEENKDEQSEQEQKTGDNAQNDATKMDLDEKSVDGETVEGTIFGTGKYRITKGSDRVVAEWVKDMSKNKMEYIFENDKLSAIRVTVTYENADQAKSDFEKVNKNEEAKKSIKNVKLDGNNIIYELEESQWEEYKGRTKDQIFDEYKDSLEELKKKDDIKSDD